MPPTGLRAQPYPKPLMPIAALRRYGCSCPWLSCVCSLAGSASCSCAPTAPTAPTPQRSRALCASSPAASCRRGASDSLVQPPTAAQAHRYISKLRETKDAAAKKVIMTNRAEEAKSMDKKKAKEDYVAMYSSYCDVEANKASEVCTNTLLQKLYKRP